MAWLWGQDITNSSCLTYFVYGGKIPALLGNNHSVYVPQSTGQIPNMIKLAPAIINKTNGGKEPLSLLASAAQLPSSQAYPLSLERLIAPTVH